MTNGKQFENFTIKCDKCKSTNVNVSCYAGGGCPSCGPETELTLFCNNCLNEEKQD